MQNFPQLRLGARLDGTVAQWHVGSRAKVGEEAQDGGSRALQHVLCSHWRRRRVRWKVGREGETGVWVVALQAVVVRGGVRAERGGVVQ